MGAVLLIIKWFFALFAFVGLGVIVVAAGGLLGFIDLSGHDLVKEVIPGIVAALVGGVMFKIFGFFVKGAWKKVEYYKAKEKQELEEILKGSVGSVGRYSSSGGYSYDRKMHDELDAVGRAMEITRTHGMDWTGYDPEASVPNPDAYSSPPGYDPEAYTGDTW